jgi:hypothetical protein
MSAVLSPDKMWAVANAVLNAPPGVDPKVQGALQETQFGGDIPGKMPYADPKNPMGTPNNSAPSGGGVNPQEMISKYANPEATGAKIEAELTGAKGEISSAAAQGDRGIKSAVGDENAASSQEQSAILEVGKQRQGFVNEFTRQYAPIMEDARQTNQAYQGAINAGRDAAKIQMTKILQSAQDVQDFQFHDYFEDKTTLGKVMGIVAQALGGAANGLAGRPGDPTAMDRVIQADLDLQKAKYAKTQGALQAQTSVYNALREKLGDDIQAQAAYNTALSQQIQNTVTVMAQRMGVPDAQAQLLSSQVAQQLAQRQTDVAKTLTSVNINAAVAGAGITEKMAEIQLRLDEVNKSLGAKSGEVSQKKDAAEAMLKSALGKIDTLQQTGDLAIAEKRALVREIAADVLKANPAARGKNPTTAEIDEEIKRMGPSFIDNLAKNGTYNTENLQKYRQRLMQDAQNYDFYGAYDGK